jgi:hypothetical protein
MDNNGKTYSYTLKLNLTGDKEIKKSLTTVSGYLDEYEKKMADLYVAPFEQAQKTTQFIEGSFKPALLTGIKDMDLLNLSLDNQVVGMVNWTKSLGNVMPLLGKVHEEAEKMAAATDQTNQKTEEATKGFWSRLKEWMGNARKALKGDQETTGYTEAFKEFSNTTSAIMDAYKNGLKTQIDDLKEELSEVNSQIAAVQKQKEASAQKELDLNKRLQDSQNNLSKNGINMTKKQRKEEEARMVQMQAGLDAESATKQALAAEEVRLQGEKEKKDALIAEKEKRMKKIELGQSMIKATVNTAESVTKMLGLMFPLNIAMAAIVTAMGVAQIGIIGRQMAKLEDGGLLEGPSHANGGIHIPGTNIEVEGGEYVINRSSTAQNRALLDYINASDRPITAADIANRQGIPLTSAGAPDTTAFKGPSTEERLLEAVEKINLSPIVSVTDIIDVQKSVVSVRDIAGF